MIHAANDFRSHVSRRSAGFFRVVLLSSSGHSKVSDPKIAILLKHQVLRLQISMNDALGMYILKRKDDTSSNKL